MGTVIVTMAGESRRFAEVGVSTPKWALKVGGRSVLARAVDSVAELLDAGWHLIFVARGDQADELAGIVEWTARAVYLDVPLAGQALSACAALHLCDPREPVAVWCADTVLLPGHEPVGASGGNWLTVAPLEGDQWSFAAIDGAGRVVRTAEKQRISDYASVGLYGFATPDLLERAVHVSTADEVFVAPLYNYLIKRGKTVTAVHVPAGRVASLGSPSEMVDTCRRLNWSLPDELAQVVVP